MKVLLADDSMTAQNMGKKILTEAGFEVIAVSNGAAAMKKIASEKPQILVLDVFMPGYSGLEVCEKVKSSPNPVPVLLTVSKLEPFRPEEGAKVKADGLIIKPFEASDLANAVKRLAAKLAPKEETPEYEKTVRIAAPIVSDDEWQEAPAEEAAPDRAQVPQAMAESPAFDLGAEPPSVAAEPPASSIWDAATAPAPVAEQPAPEPSFFSPEPEAAPEPAPEFPAHAAAPSVAPGLEPHLAPQVEVAVTSAPGFEPTIDTSVADLIPATDPALVTGAGVSEFVTTFSDEASEPVPVGYAADLDIAPAEPEPPAVDLARPPSRDTTPEPIMLSDVLPPEPEIQPVEALAPEPVEAAPEPPPAPEPQVDMLLQQMQEVVSSLPVATAPLEEVVAAPEPVPAPPAAEPIPPPPPPADEQFAAELAAAISSAPLAAPEHAAAPEALAGVPAEFDSVARAIERVLDRFKAELIGEIMRELKR